MTSVDSFAVARRKFFAQARILALRDNGTQIERMELYTLLESIERKQDYYARQPSILWYNMSNSILHMLKQREIKSTQQYNKLIDVLIRAYKLQPVHANSNEQYQHLWVRPEERARIMSVFPMVNPWTFNISDMSQIKTQQQTPFLAACAKHNVIQRALRTTAYARQKTIPH